MSGASQRTCGGLLVSKTKMFIFWIIIGIAIVFWLAPKIDNFEDKLIKLFKRVLHIESLLKEKGLWEYSLEDKQRMLEDEEFSQSVMEEIGKKYKNKTTD